MSWLETEVCTSGTLTLRAEGELAGDELPRLDVALDSVVLAREGFSGARTIRIRVPGPGRLTLGYFNDYYLSEARRASLEGLRFVGASCQAFEVDLPRATGGYWSPHNKTASLVFGVPMVLTPCAPGELTFRATGQDARGQFPILEFRSQAKLLLTLQTRGTPQKVSLKVGASSISIRLTNPYTRELADRNLVVEHLSFEPDGRPTAR